MSNITCLKLISGEEVIGKFVDKTVDGITIEDVASVVMMPSQRGDGSVSLGLMPFLPYADKNYFIFSAASIVVNFDPNIDMVNNYSRMFGAGIQVVKSI